MFEAYRKTYFFFFQPKKEEEEFLRAVEVGDIPTVRKLLGSRETDIDVNCTDILGRTPLRLAVENEHLEVTVQWFLIFIVSAMILVPWH